MTKKAYYIRPESAHQLRHLLSVPQTDLTPGIPNDGPGDFFYRWVKVTDTNSAVPTLYRPESEDWTDLEGDLILRGPTGSETYNTGDRLLAQMTGYSEETEDEPRKAVYMPVLSASDHSWVSKLEKKGKRDGCWVYSHIEQTPGKDWCSYSDKEDGIVGTIGGWVSVTLTTPADPDADPPVSEVWTVCVHEATGGSYKLKIDGGTSSSIPFDADGGTANGILSGMGGGLTVTDGDDGCIVITFDDTEKHTIEPDSTDLLPKPKNPAVEWWGQGKDRIIPFSLLPTRVRMFNRYTVSIKVVLERVAFANGTTVKDVWNLHFENVCNGTFTISYGGDDDFTTEDIEWDASGADVASAINAAAGDTVVTVTGEGTDESPWVISWTADFGSHPPSVDSTNLISCTNYGFQWEEGEGTGDGSGGGCSNGFSGSISLLCDITISCDDGVFSVDKKYSTVSVDGGCINDVSTDC